MGNVPCLQQGGPGSAEITSMPCFHKDQGDEFPPPFVAPNAKGASYRFNCLRDKTIYLGHDQRDVTPQGFLIESRPHSAPPKRYTAKDYGTSAHSVRLCASGRLLVCYPGILAKKVGALPPALGQGHAGMADAGCVLKLCTRSRPIYESVRTRSFTHTAQVVDSGIACSVSMGYSQGKFFLLPQVCVVLENGDEVLLVEDQLGPLTPPMNWYLDFALVDDGGRNLQLDFIMRDASGLSPARLANMPEVATGEEVKRGTTIRTCLQEYTTFNNQIRQPSVSFGYSSLASLSPAATVHLQHLVISEEGLGDPAPAPKFYDASSLRSLGGGPTPPRLGGRPSAPAGRIIFEGVEARATSGPLHQPQSVSPPSRSRKSTPVPPLCNNGELPNLTPRAGAGSFWHHIRYRDGDYADGCTSAEEAEGNIISGEFWLSKSAVPDKGVYFHCSCTMAQAMTMCIMFRFTCPTDYMFLIENQRTAVLRDTYIPMNGLVVGLEADPRHTSLIRMFLEHRNEIVEDMVVGECAKSYDLVQTLVDHEVYDSGGHIIYRVTVLYPGGERQAAALQVDAKKFKPPRDDGELAALGRNGEDASQASPRFPIAPSSSRHTLLPGGRILVYTSRAYREDYALPDLDEGPGVPREGSWLSVGTENEADEWGSVGETEVYGTPHATSTASAGQFGPFDSASPAVGTHQPASSSGSGSTPAVAVSCNWKKPLIDSAVVIDSITEPPFRCDPSPMES